MSVGSTLVRGAEIRFQEAAEQLRPFVGCFWVPVGCAIAPQLSADVNALRFAGLAVSWAGCWFHHIWLLPSGVVVILGGWSLAWWRSV